MKPLSSFVATQLILFAGGTLCSVTPYGSDICSIGSSLFDASGAIQSGQTLECGKVGKSCVDSADDRILKAIRLACSDGVFYSDLPDSKEADLLALGKDLSDGDSKAAFMEFQQKTGKNCVILDVKSYLPNIIQDNININCFLNLKGYDWIQRRFLTSKRPIEKKSFLEIAGRDKAVCAKWTKLAEMPIQLLEFLGGEDCLKELKSDDLFVGLIASKFDSVSKQVYGLLDKTRSDKLIGDSSTLKEFKEAVETANFCEKLDFAILHKTMYQYLTKACLPIFFDTTIVPKETLDILVREPEFCKLLIGLDQIPKESLSSLTHDDCGQFIDRDRKYAHLSAGQYKSLHSTMIANLVADSALLEGELYEASEDEIFCDKLPMKLRLFKRISLKCILRRDLTSKPEWFQDPRFCKKMDFSLLNDKIIAIVGIKCIKEKTLGALTDPKKVVEYLKVAKKSSDPIDFLSVLSSVKASMFKTEDICKAFGTLKELGTVLNKLTLKCVQALTDPFNGLTETEFIKDGYLSVLDMLSAVQIKDGFILRTYKTDPGNFCAAINDFTDYIDLIRSEPAEIPKCLTGLKSVLKSSAIFSSLFKDENEFSDYLKASSGDCSKFEIDWLSKNQKFEITQNCFKTISKTRMTEDILTDLDSGKVQRKDFIKYLDGKIVKFSTTPEVKANNLCKSVDLKELTDYILQNVTFVGCLQGKSLAGVTWAKLQNVNSNELEKLTDTEIKTIDQKIDLFQTNGAKFCNHFKNLDVFSSILKAEPNAIGTPCYQALTDPFYGRNASTVMTYTGLLKVFTKIQGANLTAEIVKGQSEVQKFCKAVGSLDVIVHLSHILTKIKAFPNDCIDQIDFPFASTDHFQTIYGNSEMATFQNNYDRCKKLKGIGSLSNTQLGLIDYNCFIQIPSFKTTSIENYLKMSRDLLEKSMNDLNARSSDFDSLKADSLCLKVTDFSKFPPNILSKITHAGCIKPKKLEGLSAALLMKVSAAELKNLTDKDFDFTTGLTLFNNLLTTQTESFCVLFEEINPISALNLTQWKTSCNGKWAASTITKNYCTLGQPGGMFDASGALTITKELLGKKCIGIGSDCINGIKRCPNSDTALNNLAVCSNKMKKEVYLKGLNVFSKIFKTDMTDFFDGGASKESCELLDNLSVLSAAQIPRFPKDCAAYLKNTVFLFSSMKIAQVLTFDKDFLLGLDFSKVTLPSISNSTDADRLCKKLNDVSKLPVSVIQKVSYAGCLKTENLSKMTAAQIKAIKSEILKNEFEDDAFDTLNQIEVDLIFNNPADLKVFCKKLKGDSLLLGPKTKAKYPKLQTTECTSQIATLIVANNCKATGNIFDSNGNPKSPLVCNSITKGCVDEINGESKPFKTNALIAIKGCGHKMHKAVYDNYFKEIFGTADLTGFFGGGTVDYPNSCPKLTLSKLSNKQRALLPADCASIFSTTPFAGLKLDQHLEFGKEFLQAIDLSGLSFAADQGALADQLCQRVEKIEKLPNSAFPLISLTNCLEKFTVENLTDKQILLLSENAIEEMESAKFDEFDEDSMKSILTSEVLAPTFCAKLKATSKAMMSAKFATELNNPTCSNNVRNRLPVTPPVAASLYTDIDCKKGAKLFKNDGELETGYDCSKIGKACIDEIIKETTIARKVFDALAVCSFKMDVSAYSVPTVFTRIFGATDLTGFFGATPDFQACKKISSLRILSEKQRKVIPVECTQATYKMTDPFNGLDFAELLQVNPAFLNASDLTTSLIAPVDSNQANALCKIVGGIEKLPISVLAKVTVEGCLDGKSLGNLGKDQVLALNSDEFAVNLTEAIINSISSKIINEIASDNAALKTFCGKLVKKSTIANLVKFKVLLDQQDCINSLKPSDKLDTTECSRNGAVFDNNGNLKDTSIDCSKIGKECINGIDRVLDPKFIKKAKSSLSICGSKMKDEVYGLAGFFVAVFGEGADNLTLFIDNNEDVNCRKLVTLANLSDKQRKVISQRCFEALPNPMKNLDAKGLISVNSSVLLSAVDRIKALTIEYTAAEADAICKILIDLHNLPDKVLNKVTFEGCFKGKTLASMTKDQLLELTNRRDFDLIIFDSISSSVLAEFQAEELKKFCKVFRKDSVIKETKNHQSFMQECSKHMGKRYEGLQPSDLENVQLSTFEIDDFESLSKAVIDAIKGDPAKCEQISINALTKQLIDSFGEECAKKMKADLPSIDGEQLEQYLKMNGGKIEKGQKISEEAIITLISNKQCDKVKTIGAIPSSITIDADCIKQITGSESEKWGDIEKSHVQNFPGSFFREGIIRKAQAEAIPKSAWKGLKLLHIENFEPQPKLSGKSSDEAAKAFQNFKDNHVCEVLSKPEMKESYSDGIYDRVVEKCAALNDANSIVYGASFIALLTFLIALIAV